jgi:hypothetical protein
MPETFNNEAQNAQQQQCGHAAHGADNAQQNAEQTMANIDSYSIALSFTMMLAQKAWIYLGKIAADPKSNEIKTDLPQAQFSIDCMAAILEKLKGRIEAKEANEIQNIITNLRLNYVSALKDNETEKK